MSLPKMTFPIFDVSIPSNKQAIKIRPFLVKEEKVLLVAQASEDANQIINAIKQVLNNCILTEGIDVDELTTFDLEYLFLKIRAKSVNSIISLTYRDTEDDKRYDFEVDIDTIEVVEEPGHSKVISANDNLTLTLKYPRADLAGLLLNVDEEYDIFFKILSYCLDTITMNGVDYSAKDSTPEEIEEFIQSLDVKTFKKIQEFFNTMPKLYHEIKYTNSLGNERVIKLTTLSDFFTLG